MLIPCRQKRNCHFGPCKFSIFFSVSWGGMRPSPLGYVDHYLAHSSSLIWCMMRVEQGRETKVYHNSHMIQDGLWRGPSSCKSITAHHTFASEAFLYVLPLRLLHQIPNLTYWLPVFIISVHSCSLYGFLYRTNGPPLWSRGQSSWLQIQRSRVRFSAPPDFL
jgi:hypothetical protein